MKVTIKNDAKFNWQNTADDKFQKFKDAKPMIKLEYFPNI